MRLAGTEPNEAGTRAKLLLFSVGLATWVYGGIDELVVLLRHSLPGHLLQLRSDRGGDAERGGSLFTGSESANVRSGDLLK